MISIFQEAHTVRLESIVQVVVALILAFLLYWIFAGVCMIIGFDKWQEVLDLWSNASRQGDRAAMDYYFLRLQEQKTIPDNLWMLHPFNNLRRRTFKPYTGRENEIHT